MKTITTNLYTIDEHPNPTKVYEWIRDNWHDLADCHIEDLVESLTAIADHMNVKVSYAISAVPSPNEHIFFIDPVTDLEVPILDMPTFAASCPFTGMMWDDIILECQTSKQVQKTCLNELHKETEEVYSEDYLHWWCKVNYYHFTEDGVFHCI